MPKHAKIVPISAGRPTSQEPHKEMMVPIRNRSFVQISFSELLMLYFQQQKTQETAQAETRDQNSERSFTCRHAGLMTAATLSTHFVPQVNKYARNRPLISFPRASAFRSRMEPSPRLRDHSRNIRAENKALVSWV